MTGVCDKVSLHLLELFLRGHIEQRQHGDRTRFRFGRQTFDFGVVCPPVQNGFKAFLRFFRRNNLFRRLFQSGIADNIR